MQFGDNYWAIELSFIVKSSQKKKKIFFLVVFVLFSIFKKAKYSWVKFSFNKIVISIFYNRKELINSSTFIDNLNDRFRKILSFPLFHLYRFKFYSN